MIKVIRTQVRPLVSVDFFVPNEQKAIYTTEQFGNTGKLTITHAFSGDTLTKVSTWNWQDQESFDTYSSNSLVIENRNAEISYHNSVGISFTETIETI